ncbi:ABC transporter substrate-binding protein [Tissierella sp. Yu-01]|uniref:ABC transporter substrate-binding protein n=1 Tax=Tissierella sp. Yu-01 TaxID=3035694 RepID=UPI00240E199D|nr:ABC transporter substrate-binding protein [Tissierella sp. Yu-01]WFA08874.1 ABC transporter substrate-binding protein [Tissierella sp. Yu-01]
MKMKKLFIITIIFTMIVSTLTACSKEQTPPTESPSNTETPMVVTDPAGNEITIPEDIDKIISMGPSITQILVELGYKDKIIAADTQSQTLGILPEDIPYIDMMSPDIEQIIALNPDFIFAIGMMMVEGNDPFKAVTDLGITVAYIPSSESIEEIYDDIEFVANVLGEEEKGQEITINMKDKIAEFKEIGDAITEKKSVYFEIGAAPYMYSFGKGVFLNEMLELIGATNALGDQESWISVSDEAILAANPDVIITNVNYIENPVDEIKSRSGWEGLKAIQNNEVYYVDNMASSVPNHNIVIALEQMAKAVYPDKY